MSLLYFATSNGYKFSEFQRLFAKHGIQLQHANLSIREIQELDVEAIARDKVVKAYSMISRPVVVDASGISMSALGGLPRGLNRPFWDVWKDQVCGVAAKLGDVRAEMIVYLAFCDGRKIHTVQQHDPGRLADRLSAVGTFNLDRVFVPDGCAMTLAEMTDDERDRVSHRGKAVIKAIELLKSIDLGRELGLL